MKLRIKKDVDLKELEKFGFKKPVLWNEYRLKTKDAGIHVNKKDRTICISNFFECDMYDLSVLYDLIKANIVERVD